ncbi:hypothetical protein T12_5207 [Trichinella patagoniensis]|uniref:CCHC-type domain-containing protein n=2 Tax=Trichinella patagoniensis TaxID=990121 RepID=A0A0V0Z571_9BILA|nr:hypothetical protein T12_5207 [Trichinella patagoniensis]
MVITLADLKYWLSVNERRNILVGVTQPLEQSGKDTWRAKTRRTPPRKIAATNNRGPETAIYAPTEKVLRWCSALPINSQRLPMASHGTPRTPSTPTVGGPASLPHQVIRRMSPSQPRICYEALPLPLAVLKLGGVVREAAGDLVRTHGAVLQYGRIAQERRAALVQYHTDAEVRSIMRAMDVQETDDFDGLNSSLFEAFRVRTGLERFFTEFFRRKQQRSECSRVLAGHLRRLFAKAFPEMSESADKILLQQFKEGLSTEAVKTAVLRSEMDNFAEAVEVAVKEERVVRELTTLEARVASVKTVLELLEPTAGRVTEAAATAVTTHKEVEDDLAEVLRQIKEVLTDNTLAGTKRPPPRPRREPERRGDRLCWKCGGLGHISRECQASSRDARASEHRLVGSCGLVARSRPRFSPAVSFELGRKGGFIAAVRRLPQLDLQLATPPSSNGCYKWKRRHLVMTEMDLTECLEKLEDFFCANGVPTSNYGVVMRYLLSDPVRCELYLYAASSSSTGELLRGAKEGAVEHIRPRECAEEVGKLGRKASVSERDFVALLAGEVASREVHRPIPLQEPPILAEAHKVAKATELGKTSNCSERPYEPLGELDASAAAAWTITDVTPPATRLKTNGGEKSDGDHKPADRDREVRPTPAGSYKELPDQCNWAMGGRWRPASGGIVPQSLTMIYDKDHQRAPALLHKKKKAQMTIRVRRPIAIAHRLVKLDPSRYVAALSLNDRFYLYPQQAYYLLMSVGIPYVQFYGAFIVQCTRPHLRQQRQQKMKKADLKTEEMDLVELDDAYKYNWVIGFSIFRLLRTEDIMRLAYTSSEMNAMAQSYFKYEHFETIRSEWA